MTPKRPVYPFAALVGQERLKKALILNAINPLIGGVLIALRPTSTKPAKAEPASNPPSPVHSPSSPGGVE